MKAYPFVERQPGLGGLQGHTAFALQGEQLVEHLLANCEVAARYRVTRNADSRRAVSHGAEVTSRPPSMVEPSR